MMFISSCFCKCYFYKIHHFFVINNLDTPSSKLQINFCVLQIDIENSATGHICMIKQAFYKLFLPDLYRCLFVLWFLKHGPQSDLVSLRGQESRKGVTVPVCVGERNFSQERSSPRKRTSRAHSRRAYRLHKTPINRLAYLSNNPWRKNRKPRRILDMHLH